jgi:NAD(P)H-nitrite reductase large subunit
MEKFRYLIVGGGVAGITAAETIRENDPDGTIAVVSDEVHPLYSRVMLSKPNFFLGKIPFDQIWLKGQKWYDEKKITFLGGQTATKIDTANKIISLADGQQINYEKLLIATGVSARQTTIIGANKPGVHYLRTLEDGQGIMEAIKIAKTNTTNAPKAIVVGGGFISFEMADLFKLAGIETTLILRERYFWEPILDKPSGLMIEQVIANAGLKILKETEVTEITGIERVGGVILKNGDPSTSLGMIKLPCNLIMFGIGAVNNIGLAKESGIATNRGILANEYLETNVPEVWTAGDIAEYKDLILDETIQLGSWVNAHAQGQVAGLNMVGKREPFKFVSFYTTQGFGMNIAFVGDPVKPGTATGQAPRTVVIRESLNPTNPVLSSRIQLIVDTLDSGRKELVGATLLNKPAEMGLIAKLIETNVDVSPHLTELADSNFDLRKLLS